MLSSLVFVYTEPRPTVPILSRSVRTEFRGTTHHPRLLFARPPSLCALPFLTIFGLHLSTSWFSLTLLESTLVDLLVSAENKGLTGNLNPLDATLTKTWGGGVVIVN